MSDFVEVRHEGWIAANRARVCAQFADLEHHIRGNVHPTLHFESLPPVVGPLVRPLLAWQVRREVRAAALLDKHDLETRGYAAAAGLRLAA